MSRIVLAALGSMGDLHPYIAVGIELQRRGHDVLLATSEAYRQKVQNEGLPFHCMRPELAMSNWSEDVVRQSMDLKKGTEYILKNLVLPFAEDTYQDLLHACQNAELLVIHPVLFVAPLVAGKLNLKWISVILAPGVFLSAYDPPLLPPIAWFQALRHFGPWPHKLLYRWIDRVTRSWMTPIGDLREKVGLPVSPKNPVHEGMFSPYGTLGWFSALLGAPQPDWPVSSEVTGFVFFDKAFDKAQAGSELDPALEQFINNGEPPVVFTLGSHAVTYAEDFYSQSLAAARIIGCRAVLLIGNEPRNRPAGAIPESVFVTGYAPYSKLFRRAAAIVHSAGIGTIGQAMQAGVPMLLVPYAADQPDNAARVERLEIGHVIPREQYSAVCAASALRELLANADYSKRAQSIAKRLRSEDGLKLACDALERHAAGT